MTLILLVIAVVGVLAIAFIVLGRHRGAAVLGDAVSNPEIEEGVVSEPVPVSSMPMRPTTVMTDVDLVTTMSPDNFPGWAEQFEPSSGRLDSAARMKLINDLGMLRAAWCIPLLERACDEEREAVNRSAAQVALARCRDEVASGL